MTIIRIIIVIYVTEIIIIESDYNYQYHHNYHNYSLSYYPLLSPIIPYYYHYYHHFNFLIKICLSTASSDHYITPHDMTSSCHVISQYRMKNIEENNTINSFSYIIVGVLLQISYHFIISLLKK